MRSALTSNACHERDTHSPSPPPPHRHHYGVGHGVAGTTTSLGGPLPLGPALPRPPPPSLSNSCLALLPQAKFLKLHQVSCRDGRYLNDQLRSKKDYRNPDFLQRMVEHFGVQELGTAFPPSIFDPWGLPQEDYISRCRVQLRHAGGPHDS